MWCSSDFPGGQTPLAALASNFRKILGKLLGNENISSMFFFFEILFIIFSYIRHNVELKTNQYSRTGNLAGKVPTIGT